MRMDMNDDLMAPPSPDEAPDAGAPPAQPDPNSGQDPAYRGPEVRCYSCEYFKEPGNCSKGVNGGTVDHEGGCNLFEMADAGGSGKEGDEPQSGGPGGPPPQLASPGAPLA